MKLKVLSLLLVSATVFGFQKPTGYVNDFAGILPPNKKQAIELHISDYHHKTGTEIAVVTVSSLEGQSVEEYANRLFREWGIGQKGKNNGLLILIAVKEHKTRIEVGYGLEPKLTDGFCGDVIHNEMVPQFKQGRFAEGIHDALNAITTRLGE